ncbi:hypothetical protein Noda2021_11020 [Candidatus Dependentiae bacterium Noda2021]|nr:hypothetical protein Noda2021_11020 [Candidatus Dependentiae bacterium Noda2021]
MKKLLSGLLILSMASALQARQVRDECDCKATSHTFFSDEWELIFGPTSPSRVTLFRDRMHASDRDACKGNGAFQAVIFGGKSTKNDRLARFFLPNCKTTLIVREQATPAVPDTDVLANYLNIYTVNGTFLSEVTFEPRHSWVGAGLQWQQAFYEREDGRALWYSIALPIANVKNRIRICENIIDNGGGAGVTPVEPGLAQVRACGNVGSCGNVDTCSTQCNTQCTIDPTVALTPVGSVTEAFAQPGWCYGRIDDCSSRNHKTGAGDLELRVGYEIVKSDHCFLDSFIGVLAPTGNRVRGRNVFEPVVGHNHHPGVLTGTSFGIEIWRPKCDLGTVWFYLDMSFEYFVERTERRSFDLKGKPWSRYMQFYANADQALLAANAVDFATGLTLHTPGINILTQDLRVKPGFLRDFNFGIAYDRCWWQAEVGYNFYARQAECVELDCPFIETAALKYLNGFGQTSKLVQINSIFPGNVISDTVDAYENNIIRTEDLCLESAAHPAVVSHTFYGSIGRRWDERERPVFVGLGGQYEVAPDNTAMNRWMVWGKAGISF